jgi:protocatechuate 3,4-dioxygenase beta subunit
MNQQGENRRDFLKRASIAAVAFPFLIGCKTDTLAQKAGNELSLIKKNALPVGAEGMGAIDAPDNVSWKTALAKATDEGEPMIVSGTVFAADGKTPVPNVLIIFITPIYMEFTANAASITRKISRLDADRRQRKYEFRSIKPASYPNTTFAAHVI